MRHDNPTSVQLGMTGSFVGKHYRVAGRIVMSMEEAGGTYYWNEFHLVGDQGNCATLVFEETDTGAEWRLFTLVDPGPRMSFSEVAGKRVGDRMEFEGETLRITCVDESRVCHIEGEAPEGVEKGDVARYFNAESGDKMIVVSWTGDDIEVYRGITLPAHAVRSAFGITAVPPGALNHLRGGSNDAGNQVRGWMILIALTASIAVFGYIWSTRMPSSRPLKLPKALLAIGSTGQLNASPYRITGRAEIEVSTVGQRYLRREYSAVDDAGYEALIWQGTDQGADKWMLMLPFTPSQPLTPKAAGGLRLGEAILPDDASVRVSQHFLSRVRQVEGTAPFSSASEFYGFVARGTKTTVVARWNQTAITFYRAHSPSPDNPSQAFR